MGMIGDVPRPRKRKYRPPNPENLPDVAVKFDEVVEQRLDQAWSGLKEYTVDFVDDQDKKMRIGSNKFDGKKGEPPSDIEDQHDVVAEVYGFIDYFASRELEGTGRFHIVFPYVNEDGEDHSRSCYIDYTPEGYDPDDATDRFDDIPLLHPTQLIEQAQPVIETLVKPMLESVQEREQSLAKRENEFLAAKTKLYEGLVSEYKGIITIQSDAIKQRDEHVKAADERMFKVNKALVGGREAELEARREAQQAFSSGIKLKMDAIEQIQEMNNQHYLDQIDRIRKDKKHDERMDFIKQFGPAALAFLPAFLQNVTAAVAKGKQGEVIEGKDLPVAAAVGSAMSMPGMGGNGVPGGPPVPLATTPTPTPSHAPQAKPRAAPTPVPPTECASSLQRFHGMFSAASWTTFREKYGVDSEQMIILQGFADVKTDLEVVGLVHRFYKAFKDETMEVFEEQVSEEQSVHMTYVLERLSELQKTAGVPVETASSESQPTPG